MSIDRESLIAAGWTPPPEDPDYEAWRPALTVYCEFVGGPMPSTPLDSIDRETIDMLRAVFRSVPK